MTTNSNNFLKFALAILLLSNSVLMFYIFKQNSELSSLNKKIDLLIKNNSENQSKNNTYLNLFIEGTKIQELKPVTIEHIEEILDIVTDVKAIEAPREEDELGCRMICLTMQEAEPQEGMHSFYDYISKNIKYPIRAIEKNIEGKVMVSFVVDKKGEIIDVEAKNDIGGGCKEEAERVIKNCPKWNPAKQRGKTVKVRMNIPIIFKLENK